MEILSCNDCGQPYNENGQCNCPTLFANCGDCGEADCVCEDYCDDCEED